jgi:5-methylthioadenosine/S-adenosylhomocysteine deaminase
MAGRLLLNGGYVLSMDEGVGELPRGDVLIEGSKVVAVQGWIEVEDVERLDVSGHVVMPGFVDAHRHTWQTRFGASVPTGRWRSTSGGSA